jgi:hypothetical protein
MPSSFRAQIRILLAVILSAASFGSRIEAQTVWSGFTKSFTKADGADGSLPENQDILTPNVTFARSFTTGLYNASTEPNFLAGTSPDSTEWATDLVSGNESQIIVATNWAALSFTDWVDAFGGQGTHALPTNLTTHNAVVHLISDNVYLDLKFTSWGSAGAGGFSYLRAEPPGPTGDYNGNHIVDAADYTVWRDTFGQMVANGTGADGNGDGTINTGDYDFWKMKFGNPAGAGSGAAIAAPEPTSLALLALGSLALAVLCAGRQLRTA